MNWVEGEPNDAYDGQDCALINHDIDNGLGRWDDEGCDVTFPYVCELGKTIFYNTDSSTIHVYYTAVKSVLWFRKIKAN